MIYLFASMYYTVLLHISINFTLNFYVIYSATYAFPLIKMGPRVKLAIFM
jgi:hypothetical protein